jgi:hypothetical protein
MNRSGCKDDSAKALLENLVCQVQQFRAPSFSRSLRNGRETSKAWAGFLESPIEVLALPPMRQKAPQGRGTELLWPIGRLARRTSSVPRPFRVLCETGGRPPKLESGFLESPIGVPAFPPVRQKAPQGRGTELGWADQGLGFEALHETTAWAARRNSASRCALWVQR